MKKIILLYIIGCYILDLSGQNISNIKLGDWMCCNLHSVLTEISETHNIKFSYDTKLFEEIECIKHPVNKPLDLFLEQICKENKLKYYISADDSVVHIVSRHYIPTEEVYIPEEDTEKKIKKYTGNPERFNFNLSGKVVDVATMESLPFVSIYVIGTTTGTTSNQDGLFTLLNVPSDTVTIIFQYLGYETRQLFLSPETLISNLTVEMKTNNINLDEVVVRGNKQDILQVNGTQISMIKMSPVKLKTLPNLGEQDILRSFQLMPGISAANENSSGLYVRGGTPDQVLIQYDGFTVYNVEHLFGFFSAFNSNAIKDVQLYKGGFDAKYGGRLSSVVEITGKEGNQREFNGAIDASLMSANAFFEFPVGEKISAIIAGRRSWKSPLYNKIFEQFTEEDKSPFARPGGRGGPGPGFGGQESEQETKSYFYDLNTKITYRPTKKDVISLSIYNGKDNLDNSINPSSNEGFGGRSFNMNMETTDLTKWGNSGVSLKWSRRFLEKLYTNTVFSFSNYYSLRERSTSGSFRRGDEGASSISRGVRENNNLFDYTIKSDFNLLLSDKQQLEFGLQAIHNDIDYTYIQNDTLTVVSRALKGEIYSGYLQNRISLVEKKFIVTPGLRYNYFTVTSKSYLEPRLNLSYQVSKKLILKASTGNYYQFAKRVIREDITEGSRDFWVLSDDDNLPVSSAWHYIGGFTIENLKYLIDVEGFYKDLNNITEYSLRIDPDMSRGSGPGGPGGGEPTLEYNENFFTGSGIAKGIDFLLQKKTGNITGWLGYTLEQVTNNIEEFGDYDFYAAQDVTHEFKTVCSYKFRRWDFGANWIYASGRPYTSPEGGYQLTLLDGNTSDYINVSVKNGNRLPAYHRLDLSATYNFKLGIRSPATIGLSIFNVYNRANVWYNEYEIVDNEVIEIPVYYLGITPNISFTLKFK